MMHIYIYIYTYIIYNYGVKEKAKVPKSPFESRAKAQVAGRHMKPAAPTRMALLEVSTDQCIVSIYTHMSPFVVSNSEYNLSHACSFWSTHEFHCFNSNSQGKWFLRLQ